MKIFRKIAAVAIGMSLVFIGASPVSASTTSLDSGVESELREFLNTFSVDKQQQATLLTGLANGQAWDSFSGEADPVLVETVMDDGIEWNVVRYPDGSVAASHVGLIEDAVERGLASPQAAGEVSPLGVNNCGYQPNVYATYYDCNIYFWVGAAAASFVADFQIRSGYDRILNAHSWSPTIVGSCAVNITDSGIQRPNENAGAKAMAGFTFTAWVCVVPVPYNFYTYLYVGGDTAEHVHNS